MDIITGSRLWKYISLAGKESIKEVFPGNFLQVNNALFCLNIIIIKLAIIKLYCQVIWINNET